MMTEIIIALVGVISTITSSVVTFFLTKRKYNVEVDGDQILNMQNSLEFYENLSDDNKRRLDECLLKNKQLEAEVADLRRIVLKMVTQICTDIMCQHRQLDKEQCDYYTQALRNFDNMTNDEQQ